MGQELVISYEYVPPAEPNRNAREHKSATLESGSSISMDQEEEEEEELAHDLGHGVAFWFWLGAV